MSHNRKTCPECQFETSMDEVHIIGENHTRSCSQYGRGEACPSISETFEGDNSSLKKTFEEAARHDPENKACAQAGYGDNYHGLGKIDCTCPAQKEDAFSDFLKSHGIKVVDVTPAQKEGECICHARAENPKAPLDPQCPFHFPKEDTVRSAPSLKSNAPKV